jgi:hypothetical protein
MLHPVLARQRALWAPRSRRARLASLVPLSSLLLFALASAPSLGCRARLPQAQPSGHEGLGGAPGALEVLPARPLDALAAVTHFRVVTAEPIDAPLPTVLLVAGALSDTELRKLEGGSLTKALAERALPASVLRTCVDRGEACEPGRGGSAVLVAPSAPLESGPHTLFVGGVARALFVAPRASDRLLERVFPAHGGQPLSVLCADAPLVGVVGVEAVVSLEPSGSGLVRSLALGGSGCVTLALEGQPAGLVLPPAALEHGAETLLFDPRPLEALAAPLEPVGGPSAPPACEGGPSAGPLCLRVEDDRLVLEASAPGPHLVAFEISGAATLEGVLVVEGAETVRGLVPSASHQLSFEVLGADGARAVGSLSLSTGAPRARPVLAEALANPVGKEPREEWLELYDDGLAPVELEGYVLREPGGDVVLPAHLLEPGAFVLVVRDDFVGDGLFDVAPVDGAPLLRVPSLGGNGLSNAGEPLLLVDPDGLVVSRMPAVATPHAGRSLCRRWPFGHDDSEAAFVEASPTPGASGCSP